MFTVGFQHVVCNHSQHSSFCQGHKVCRASFLRLLGVGKQRLQRTKKRFRGIDDRTLNHSIIAGLSLFYFLAQINHHNHINQNWIFTDVCFLFPGFPMFSLFDDVTSAQVAMQEGPSKQHLSTAFSVTFGGLLLNLCQSSFLVWGLAFSDLYNVRESMCLTSNGFSLFYLLLLKKACLLKIQIHWRFQSSTTAALTKTDDELREQLLKRLISDKLMAPSRQATELKPGILPLRELPPGNTASLFLMYIAYMKTSDVAPAGKTTCYEIAKQWRTCLRFRRATEHSMCLVCQTLKAAIHNATDGS